MFRVLAMAVSMLAATFASAETRVPQSTAEISISFAPLVKQAAPAVANIYASRLVQAEQSPFMGDPFFQDFFRGIGTPQPRVQNSLGSGVILSADGILVSNYHVVGMATDIRVVLADRREYSAHVVLGDQESDLAILQIEDAGDLPHLTLRSTAQVEVGELVLAIGNPFGIGQTVSSGIVSGLARSGTATGNARGYFIQTDAAINPGNSGGALIDINGALIGINTSILSRSGGSNGIGFAIPADLVAEFVDQARAGNDQFLRPWAGMAGQPVDSDIAGSLGLQIPEGILVADLHRLSPYVEAGFQVGDIITQVDDQPVNSPTEMVYRMSVAGVGDTAMVTRLRGGETAQVGVQMITAPDEPPSEEIQLPEQSALPLVTLARANPAVIARFGLPLTTKGVVITDPGPAGARSGLLPADVILAINGTAVARPADVTRQLEQAGRWLQFDLLRGGQTISMRFRL